jgi:hypothetical protein
LSQYWRRPVPDDYDSSQSSPTSIDTDSTSMSVAEASHFFYLILESVQHYPGRFRRFASFSLPEKREVKSYFLKSQPAEGRYGRALQMIADLPWKQETVELI